MSLEAIVDQWFRKVKGRNIDIFFSGRVFGGRPGESPQTPTDFQLVDQVFIVRFQSTERLTVLDPKGVELFRETSLIINEASDARFGWHSYGRPQVPENWCEEIYRLRDARVEVVRIGHRTGTRQIEKLPYEGKPFVELRAGWC